MLRSRIMIYVLTLLVCILPVSGMAAGLTHSPLIGAVTDTTGKIWLRADANVNAAIVQYQAAGGNWSQLLQSAPRSLYPVHP